MSIENTSSRYITFSLGEERFGIPLLTVREVIAMPEVTPVPQSPAHFVGIMNLRGQIISVVDLRLKMGIKPKNLQETAVIICDLGTTSIGVVVDSIDSVLSPEPNEISDRPEIPGGKNSEYISAVYRQGENLILLLEIEKALDAKEFAIMKRATHTETAKAA